MGYSELKARQGEEYNKFPLGVAFGDRQFEKMMSKWGLSTSIEDCKKIVSLGSGCYIRKQDVNGYCDMLEKFNKEKKDFLATKEGLKDALKYEFDNQECGYTWEFEEGITALGWNVKKFFASKKRAAIFEEAKQEYIDSLED